MEPSGPLDVLLAEQKEKQADILEIRSMIYEALRPGAGEIYDISLPRTEIAGHLDVIRELEEVHRVPLPTIGHTGDGNTHTTSMRVTLEEGVLGEPIEGWQEKNRVIEERMYDDAMARGGVISGEHGIGLVKKKYLSRNVGEHAVAVMRSIKHALDPEGILNPGKIFQQ